MASVRGSSPTGRPLRAETKQRGWGLSSLVCTLAWQCLCPSVTTVLAQLSFLLDQFVSGAE